MLQEVSKEMAREDLKILTNRPAINHEQAAEVLFNCASLLQMAGANEYRIAHYRDAARTMLRLGPVALEAALNEELWPQLGLGKRLGNKVRELVRDGAMQFYVELRADLPPAVDQLMRVNGVGPKLATRLHKELGVNTPAELADAARHGQVAKLRGFGAKRQASYARILGPNPPTSPAASTIRLLPRQDDEQVDMPQAA